jgi:hypothetical protein
MDAEIALESFTNALVAADSLDACWTAIRRHYATLGFSAAHLQLNGVVYRDWEAHVAAPEYWTIRIPLAGNGFIELARDFRAKEARAMIAPLADLLHRALARPFEEKLSQGAVGGSKL